MYKSNLMQLNEFQHVDVREDEATISLFEQELVGFAPISYIDEWLALAHKDLRRAIKSLTFVPMETKILTDQRLDLKFEQRQFDKLRSMSVWATVAGHRFCAKKTDVARIIELKISLL